MNDKFEYSDLYKFVTSLGVALLVVGCVLPWFFLKEPFDLTIKQSELVLLTPIAQRIIEKRQNEAGLALQLLPWVSAIFCIVGVGFFAYGLNRWWRRQDVRDRAENASMAKLEAELSTMLPAEVEQKVLSEIEAEVATPIEQPVESGQKEKLPTATMSSQVAQYRALESLLLKRLQECYSRTYSVSSNQKLGAAEFDLVLKSNDSSREDVIFEIKRGSRSFGYNWWRDNVKRLEVLAQLYRSRLKTEVEPILFVIYPHNVVPSPRMKDHAETAIRDFGEPGSRARICTMAEHELNSYSCSELRSKLGFLE